ncbi:MAG: S41 family peptidase [Verrucomicrobia bacterium]|nr:MAG: S41 family peptidase [Verrucomicrobiota bacterium]TAE87339.1 MAG: S41 family peptidase [Verrucomicrobiota bacterium]TAF25194.1 MAG: S41 family peptidase [Verrucomicrobiota bacterium]TAF40839.1 MAG: S41 family peptidase [Verrucomicrobiota bacterium]
MRALLFLLVPGLLSAGEKSTTPDPDEAAYPAIERFVTVLEQVRKRHPDADRVAYDRLVNHALEGMLASLDPFSSFIHPEMASALEADPKLDPFLPSLGITLGLRDDGLYLANVAPATPAYRAGLLPGSTVLAIDGNPPPPLAELLSSLRKAPGEKTRLTLKSPSEPKAIEVALIHIAVEDRAVTDARLLDPQGTGYLRLASFMGSCARETEAALDELEDQGMKSLILDLRGNPGGDLHQTVEILGLFLPPSTPVVTTRGRGGETLGKPLTTPTRQRHKRDYPIHVLIDRMSASASELTAGALQDLKRATIVGETSYGKGSVQNIIPCGSGTALRLTIATYHTPSGKTPHRVGITPDLKVDFTDADRERLALSYRRAALTAEETKQLESWTDPVIQAALKPAN